MVCNKVNIHCECVLTVSNLQAMCKQENLHLSECRKNLFFMPSMGRFTTQRGVNPHVSECRKNLFFMPSVSRFTTERSKLTKKYILLMCVFEEKDRLANFSNSSKLGCGTSKSSQTSKTSQEPIFIFFYIF